MGFSEDSESVGEGLRGWGCLGLSLWTLSRGAADQGRSEWEIKGSRWSITRSQNTIWLELQLSEFVQGLQRPGKAKQKESCRAFSPWKRVGAVERSQSEEVETKNVTLTPAHCHATLRAGGGKGRGEKNTT